MPQNTHAQAHREAAKSSKVFSVSLRGRVMGGSEKSPHCHTEGEGGLRTEKRVRRVKQGLVGKNQTQSN